MKVDKHAQHDRVLKQLERKTAARDKRKRTVMKVNSAGVKQLRGVIVRRNK